VAPRLATVFGAALLLIATPAGATFRGHNGLIAFTRLDGKVNSIFAISPNGGSERTIAKHARDPAWSADGKHLAFDSRRSGDSNLYVADADGKNVHERSLPVTDEYDPAWSPDGKQLVFDRGGGIYLLGRSRVNANGIAARHLIGGSFRSAGKPVWSPNGKWIAFLYENVAVKQTESDVFLIHPNGSGLRELTSTGFDEGRPSWSPDGTRLLFDRYSLRKSRIIVLTLRTGRERLLVAYPALKFDSTPEWSPDGTTIAFTREHWVQAKGEEYFVPLRTIYLADANGSSVRRLTSSSEDDWAPAWQPLP
jgi:Tol biopolymer transport system component